MLVPYINGERLMHVLKLSVRGRQVRIEVTPKAVGQLRRLIDESKGAYLTAMYDADGTDLLLGVIDSVSIHSIDALVDELATVEVSVKLAEEKDGEIDDE